jgi:hypothetical protein
LFSHRIPDSQVCHVELQVLTKLCYHQMTLHTVLLSHCTVCCQYANICNVLNLVICIRIIKNVKIISLYCNFFIKCKIFYTYSIIKVFLSTVITRHRSCMLLDELWCAC